MELIAERQVGVCLKHLPSATTQPDSHHNDNTVPWQRVINAKGAISPRLVSFACQPTRKTIARDEPGSLLTFSRGANGAARQAVALRQEGVTVSRGALGEHTVDFSEYGWFPHMLPSDEAESGDSDSDEET